MAEEHHSRVIVEGDSTSYVVATQKAATATDDFEKSTRKAAKSSTDFSGANEKAAKSSEKVRESSEKATKSASGFGAIVKKASDPLVELSKNATRSGASVVQLGQSVFNVAKAFGGWGVAVAIVGDLLLGLVESSNKAAEATKRANEEAKKARMLKDEQDIDRETERKLMRMSHREEQAETRRLAAAKQEVVNRNAEIFDLEKEVIRLGKDRRTAAAYERQISELRIENMVTMGDLEGAAQARREEEKRQLQEKLDLETKITGQKQAQAKFSGNFEGVAQGALGFKGFSGVVGDVERKSVTTGGPGGRMNLSGTSVSTEEQRIAAEERRMHAKQSMRSVSANDAQYVADTRLRAIEADQSAIDDAKRLKAADVRMRQVEIDRNITNETLSLINQEEEARRRLLQTQYDAATTVAERQQLQSDMEQVQHEARLKRIDAERAAEEKKAARKVALMDLVDRVAAGSAATATMIARTAGASAKKQEQIAAGVAGGQAIIIGVLESVKAAAAFASFNPIQGAMHVAAAAFAYAQGGMLLAQAGGAGGSSSGASSAGGGGMPSGGTQSEPSGQTFRGGDSAIPGSPGPQSPTAVGSSAGPNRTTVIQINGDVYGTPRKEFIRSIREGLDLDRQGGRARRTGSDG